VAEAEGSQVTKTVTYRSLCVAWEGGGESGAQTVAWGAYDDHVMKKSPHLLSGDVMTKNVSLRKPIPFGA
jgi:hypothetical protein